MNPIKSINAFFTRIPPGKVLVALSGGADSVCLLLALKEYGADVCAFHLNHCIRGEEADRDQEFCRKLCEKENIPFSASKADVPAYAVRNSLSLEEAARKLRYQALGEELIRVSADYIATAHNADDNAETVIFNLVRGCSADGLTGIPAVRGKIIRPLLASTRDEIEGYLGSVGASYVIDSTNLTDDYTRNRIRHLVMPILREINPSVAVSISRMCDSLQKDKKYFADVLNESEKTPSSLLPLPLLTRQIASRFLNETGVSLENVHINKIAGFVKDGACVTLDLPGKNCVYISHGEYKFDKREDITPYNAKISPGLTEIPEINAKFFYGKQNVYKLSTSVAVNCDKIIGDLYARPRNAGDRIRIFGISKDVRKELINKKIPLCIRRRLPVIYDEEGVVYVPYIGADDRVFSKTGQMIIGLVSPETENSYEK